MKIETGEANPDHRLILGDIAVQVIMICTEATLGHNTGINAATTEIAHDDPTHATEGTVTDLNVTHHINHITDHPNIKVLQVINPAIVVGHTLTSPTDFQGMNLTNHIHTPAGQEEGHTQRRT